MANVGENHDPVRIIGGKQIIYGTRSICDARDWNCCRCGETNRAERRLIFDIPAFRCKCGEKFCGDMDFCLANVTMNGIPLLGMVKKQRHTESECIPYALSYVMEIMNNSSRACSSEHPNIESSRMDPSDLFVPYRTKFPDLKSGLHKLLHLCQLIRKEGVFFQSGAYYEVGKTRVIHCDNFEEICRLIADGLPVLAAMTTGYKYKDLLYCQFYTSVPAIEPHIQRLLKAVVEGGHIVCLIGAVCMDGQRGYYGLDAAGEVFCPQFVSEADGIGVVPPYGFGKINASSDFSFNFLAFTRKDEDCEDEDDVELVDEDENATNLSQENKDVMVQGGYFKKRLTTLNEILASYGLGDKDGEAPECSARGSARVARSQ